MHRKDARVGEGGRCGRKKRKRSLADREHLSHSSFLFYFLVNPKGTLRGRPPREELGSSEVGEVSE